MTTLKQLEGVTGTLSKPSKMPCNSYSINPANCKVGQKLARVKGSTCSDCYACKGNYKRYSSTMEKAWGKREANLASMEWIEAMVELIQRRDRSGYFRWHDSGDLQSMKHLLAIIVIARRLPDIKFWLPTKEKRLVNALVGKIPNNLTIRLSAAMIDGKAPRTNLNTATVTTKPEQATCRSFEQSGKCGDCRKCWNKSINNIVYLYH